MKRVLYLALLLTLVSGVVFADGPETGVVTGTVIDADGNGLPGVVVTLSGERGAKTTATDENGEYLFALLIPGPYSLSAMMEGWTGGDGIVRISAGDKSVVDLRLSFGTEETILVTSEAPMVDKYDVSTGGTVQAETVGQVAAVNRGIYGAINVLPGVTNDQESLDLSSSRPSFNGTPWQESAVFIDGVDATFTRYGATRMFLPTSATSEVSLEIDGKGVDYGRSVGGVTNVIVKSGTNQFHGEATGIYRDLSWDANFDCHPALADTARPVDPCFLQFTDEERDVSSTTFEASLGGPLKRDKAWFFIGAADFGTFTRDRTLDGSVIDQSTDVESYIAKLNFQPGASHQLAVSWIATPITRLFQTETFADVYTPTMHDIGGSLTSFSWNYSLSPSLFLETKLAQQTSSEDKLFGVCNCTDLDRALAIKQGLEPSVIGDGVIYPADPSVTNPDAPVNNFWAYLDYGGSAGGGSQWYNGWILDNGFGTNEYPRDQFNIALTQFAGANHELKYGVDWQQTSWEQDVERGAFYYGVDFNPFADSGYDSPAAAVKIDYQPADMVAQGKGTGNSQGENFGLYVRDRMSFGDHWTLNLGVRIEDQQHTNDTGRVVIDSTDFSPRATVVYDIKADGKMLLSLSSGRYITHVPQEMVNTNMLDGWNGFNAEDRYFRVTPLTGTGRFLNFIGFPFGYTFPIGGVRPGTQWVYRDLGLINSDIDPSGRDELVLGFEWQFTQNWAASAKAIYWETFNQIINQEQLDPITGGVFDLSANIDQLASILGNPDFGWVDRFATDGCADSLGNAAPCGTRADALELLGAIDDGFRDYQGLQLQLNRRFRGGWALYNHLTFAASEGNVFGSVFDNTSDSYAELIHLRVSQADIGGCEARNPSNGGSRVDDVDCAGNIGPLVGQSTSIAGRFGDAIRERDYIWRTYGFKVWNFGRQTFNLGGQFTIQDGVKWSYSQGGLQESSDESVPAGGDTSATLFVERRGGRQIDGYEWLNLSGAWGFPLGRGGVDGELRLEITNVFDGQDQVGVQGGTGNIGSSKRYWAQPRKYRLVGTIRF